MSTFAERFRAVAAREASRVAIEDGATQVTYSELAGRAGAVAAYLRRLGAASEDIVALRTGNRVSMVCGMLGAWMANAAFVIITPDLPADRAQRMARAAAFILDDGVLNEACLRADPPNLPQTPTGALAYVVFTSGTTGVPKGVLVTHEGIVPMLDAQIAAFEIMPGARCLWLLSPLFDASVSDVGTALLAGATLVVERGVGRLAPRALLARMDALSITHVDLPPSLLALLDPAAFPESLHTIVVGGEACGDAVVERVASCVRLVNVYGPTEATVCTSLGVCRAGERHEGRLGLPLAHVRYRVEDGELLIGGSCLARGYLGDEALTARRFVTCDGERFYRTGDRVRRREPDEQGELEIVGRVDRQVKIAGVRIEPEEIETRLRDDPDVVDVAVVPSTNRRSLVAFVVSPVGCADTIRARLERLVPSWLVPARFVMLDVLPRLVNDKVDLAALVAMTEAPQSMSTEPRVRAEDTLRVLREAMAGALNRTSLAPHEDFIALGADSLCILEACAAADARGVIVSPETIATERTAERVAASRELAGATAIFLEADIATLRAERGEIETHARGARTVFVTGATGTLGTRLVRELAAKGAAVTCLVRARDDDAAHARLCATMKELPHGVRAVAGDVAMPHFAMARGRWVALASEHDAIVHAAADLSLAASYADLRATNVVGAAHALDFAREQKPKALHHVSTLSVLASTNLARSGRTFFEAAPDTDHVQVVYGAYAQTKWAADTLVQRVAKDAVVHRLGLLLPARRLDLFTAFVRGVAMLGCAPSDPALRFDVTPAAFAARALAHFVVVGSDRRVRHIANRWAASIDDLVAAMRSLGVSVECVSIDMFRARLDARPSSPRMGGLSVAALRATGDLGLRAFDLFEATNVQFGSERTLAELARAGIACPAPTDVLAEYVRIALSGPSA